MPVKIEIAAETPVELLSQLDTLATAVGKFVAPVAEIPDVQVTLQKAMDGASLDELRRLIIERFDREGFEVTIVVKEIVDSPATGRKKGAKGRPPLVEQEAAKRKLKGNGAGNGSEPSSGGEPDPEGDRAHVIGELSKRFNDPKQRPAVTAFSNRMSKQFGKNNEKLSLLPSDVFPAIRAEYDKEFGVESPAF